MYIGFGSLILLTLFIVAIWLSVAKEQRRASWIAGAGAFLLAYFAVSVRFGESFPFLALPYRMVNLYLFLMMAAVLFVGGCIGLVVRLIHYVKR